jgi:tRNA (guanine26-N2/guanine27-N2)-dimethyltransferase
LEKNYLSYSWTLIKEGYTQILVPSPSLIQKEPSKFPAFFNPAARFNREISIMIYKNFLRFPRKNLSFVDSLCGVGARGLRVAKEIPNIEKVIFNDYNHVALQNAKASSVLNNIYHKCNFSHNEVCNFLQNRFDYLERGTIIDLDPFGSPAQYIDCILRAIENDGMLSVTATDTAVLLGVYPRVCYRKYYGIPLRTKYSLEIGTRILLACIAMVASRFDMIITPIFAHSYRNYIRVYCKVSKSNQLANRVSENIGYVQHCFECGYRALIKLPDPNLKCKVCQRKTRLAGPLWSSKIFDKNMIDILIQDLVELQEKADNVKTSYVPIQIAKKFFSIARVECDNQPYHYLTDEFGKFLRNSTLPVRVIVQSLQEEGFKSSPTIFSSTGFKSEANVLQIQTILTQILSK